MRRQPAWAADKLWFSVASDGDGLHLISPVYADRLYTTIAAVPTPVPTLSEWGMLLLAGLVAGYGAWTLRQRPLRRRSRPQTG